MTFLQLLRSTYKSADTEENIDIYFTRPCGLVLTLMYKALGFHPNAVTFIGIIIGVVSAFFFYREDLCSNIIAAALITLSNFHDSADGQLARMTNKKSLIGRMLDGVSSDIVFFFVYVALWLRIGYMYAPEFGAPLSYGVGFIIGCAAGFGGHSGQACLADYYRQIHLLFLNGFRYSEFNTSESQREIAMKAKRENRRLDYAFFINYSRYCHRQEGMTPCAQRFLNAIRQNSAADGTLSVDEPLRQAFLDGSRPLMKWANFLTYNWRAIFLITSSLANLPWIYLIAEFTLFEAVKLYMRHKHEKLCRELTTPN